MKYPIAMTVLQYLIFPNFTREFLKLFRARVVGQGKEILSAKSVRPKVLEAKPKQAGKKGGGWGEGIFARLLPFPFRLSKRKAEGGFGGNSAFLLPNQNEASPATCLNTWKAGHHRKILFSLKEEKIGRAQNEKSKEYFSVVWRACRAVAGLASLVGGLLKESSNISQKTPPSFTFSVNNKEKKYEIKKNYTKHHGC